MAVCALLQDNLDAVSDALRLPNLLNREQIHGAAQALIAEEVCDSSKKRFLSTFHERGETPMEIALFAEYFRGVAINPGLEAHADRAIDVCGTGGDRSGSFNVSTTTAFILAASGIPVYKHGNRSITSRSGSADLLEALGIPLQLETSRLAESIEALHFCFLFAPAFHPAFKAIMPVRKALASEGKKTFFNILGPLINPGRPANQLIGVFCPSWVTPIAEALNRIPVTRGLVVHTRLDTNRGLDEISHAGSLDVECAGAITPDQVLSLKELIQAHGKGDPSHLVGGDTETNLTIMKELLTGKGPRDLIITVCLNAAAAFLVAGDVDNAREGFQKASELLQSGAVDKWLQTARAYYRS